MTDPTDPRSAEEAAYLAALGQRVRHLRAVRGMSRKVLARTAAISERYVAQLEAGKGNVSITLLRRLAAAMGTPVEDVVGDPGDPPDWPVFRELLRAAGPGQISAARLVLSPGSFLSPTRRPRVALIGLRGAGKSTLGRVAAERLDWPFVELNEEIAREAGLSVAEIFALYGQEGFRKFELAALRRVMQQPAPMLLATGGGIVGEPYTFEMLRSNFVTIWLKATAEEHMARVRAQGDRRPMADDRAAMTELKTILAHRAPLYSRAAATVDTAGLDRYRAAEELIIAIRIAAPDVNRPGLTTSTDDAPAA
ncbi:MAG: helix-turn-helix transcriptional regulator [Alphaproteobacteria bacterium]